MAIDKERLEAHLNNGEVEYVMCAANYYDDGKDYMFQPYNIDKGFVLCGWRHPCIFQQLTAFGERQFIMKERGVTEIQGFLTTKNRFLDREGALELVLATGQLSRPLIGSVLTSEDLW